MSGYPSELEAGSPCRGRPQDSSMRCSPNSEPRPLSGCSVVSAGPGSSAKARVKTVRGLQKKNQKAKTDLKPNSSEVHSYLLAGNQARSQGQKCGHSGATGTPHNQETRTRSATQPAAPH